MLPTEQPAEGTGKHVAARARGGETLAERLFEELGEAIVRGELPLGSKISEPTLARRYGVSRGPLREALHRLQERKLITRSANQGARVVQPSASALNELFTVREALEGVAAREAARNIADDELAELRAVLDRHRREVGTGRVDVHFGGDSADRDFHVLIAQASRNELLINLLCREFYPLLRLYRGTTNAAPGRQERALIEHGRIFDAIADRDPDTAEHQMRRHIMFARERREMVISGS